MCLQPCCLRKVQAAVQTDVAHLAGGDHGDHTVDHAETGAQNRNNGKLFAGQTLYLCVSNGSFDLDFLERKVARGFITHEHGDLADELTEFLHARVLIAEDGQLMLDQGVVKYMQLTHCFAPLYIYILITYLLFHAALALAFRL